MATKDLIYFFLVFIFKYNRLIIQGVSYLRYRVIPIPKNPVLTPIDVTTVIATLGKDLQTLSQGIQCHMQAGSKYISIYTPPDVFNEVETVLRITTKRHDDVIVKVSIASHANKREQLVSAIRNIAPGRREAHKIIIFADDDITFLQDTIKWMLAPFQNNNVGGVGTYQQAKRITTGSVLKRVINWVFADYIERRTFENLATLTIDGSILCLSGRMAGFRSKIVEDPRFLSGFVAEKWNGRKLNADDDNY